MSSNTDSFNALGSSTITKVFTDEASHTWTIENFDLHLVKKKALKSSTFVAATNDKYKWRLIVKFDNNYFNLSLILDFDDSTIEDEVYAKLLFRVFDNKQRTVWSHLPGIRKYVKSNAEYAAACLSLGEQFRCNYLFDNKLTVRCDVTISNMETIDQHVFQVPKCDLSEDLSSLLENHHLSDVVLSANGKDYPAHKIILAARCTVFAAMFKYDTKEKIENRVEISDMNEEVLGELLRYIYTGKCENLKNLAEDLLVAADKYALDRLKVMCAKVLSENLSIENVSQILMLADMHGVDELKKEAIKLIVAKPTEVLVTAGEKSFLSNPKLVEEVFQKK